MPSFTLNSLQEVMSDVNSGQKPDGQRIQEHVFNAMKPLMERNTQLESTVEQLSDGFTKLWAAYQEVQACNQKNEANFAQLSTRLKKDLTQKDSELKFLQQAYQQLIDENNESAENHTKLKVDYEKLQKSSDQVKTQFLAQITSLQAKVKQIEDCWKVTSNQVQIMTSRKLGGGAYGAVYEGQFGKQKVAVKQLHQIIVSDANIEKIHDEINTMSRLRHPNLILFIAAVCDQKHNPLIITELMDMSLRDAYEKKLLTSEREKLVITRDAAAGLNYLHCLPDPIIHRDVSSANVLLASKGPGQWIVKISDFGSAKLVRCAVTANPGAAVYSAPEALQAITVRKKKEQTTKLDVYSFGILLCEVMICQFPADDSFDAMLKELSTSCPPIHKLIRQCIEHEAEDRPTMLIVIESIDSYIGV